MRTWLKRTLTTTVSLAVVAFMVFLYNMPPFFLIAPETFGADMAKSAPPVEAVADPAARAIAEHGRRIVMNAGCIGCHATNGSQGPDLSKYLAGGGVKLETRHGTFVSRNLTSDPETGLARRTDEDVKRVLRSGTFPDGHVTSYTTMPWASYSNWTEEDRHAVVVYLRTIPSVRHAIPEPSFEPAPLPPGAVEGIFGLKDYGIN
jgi:mono/diheme cytochrome c family protein